MLELQAKRAHAAGLHRTERVQTAFKLLQAGRAGQPSAKQLKTSNQQANHIAVSVVGKVGGETASMLVDTGSAATIIRADIWKRVTENHLTELKLLNQPGFDRSGHCYFRGRKFMYFA